MRPHSTMGFTSKTTPALPNMNSAPAIADSGSSDSSEASDDELSAEDNDELQSMDNDMRSITAASSQIMRPCSAGTSGGPSMSLPISKTSSMLPELSRKRVAPEMSAREQRRGSITPQLSHDAGRHDVPEESAPSSYQPRAQLFKTLSSTVLTVSAYAEAIEHEVAEALRAEKCFLFVVDDVRKEIRCLSTKHSIRCPLGKGSHLATVVKTGKPVNTQSHKASSSKGAAEHPGVSIRSLLCVPIMHMLNLSQTVGVLEVVNKLEDKDFSTSDTTVLETIARLVGDSFNRHRWNALENIQSHGDNEALSLLALIHSGKIHQPPTATCNEADLQAPVAWEKVEEGKVKSDLALVKLKNLPLSKVLTLGSMQALNFSALDYADHELLSGIQPVFEHTGCMGRCRISPIILQNWALAVRNGYHANPFHNWFHGFSVFQMCYFQLFRALSILEKLTLLDVFGLLISCLCHDLDHPGFNNSYLIETESPLALRHNDISVLENHHASLTCELMRREACAIAAGLDQESRKKLRGTIIRCILDTDMAHHAAICQKLQGTKVLEDKQLLKGACIHSCDLSAQVLPWQTASKWEELISAEFFNQANEERSAGRTPAPFMDFQMHDLKQRGKLQRDFLDFVLIPFWNPFTELIPELRQCYRNLLSNREKYDKRASSDMSNEESVRGAEKLELRASGALDTA
eukprot:TRINITY_DN27244_c0_g3_i1.p1 TRINITY_DN27244_c0_g3~~TRINITY_DN27244_c0_g3_i1.p1  ORF type:complete len:722 (-),score=97.72 TRINITY_DN27244_c0_g3_i1:271-2340(-)